MWKRGFWQIALLATALYGAVVPAEAVTDAELLPRLQAINIAADDTKRAPLLQALVYDLGGLDEAAMPRLPVMQQLWDVANSSGLDNVKKLLEPLRRLWEIEVMPDDMRKYTMLRNFLNGLGDISAYLRPFPVVVRRGFNGTMERLLLLELREIEREIEGQPATARNGVLLPLINDLGGVRVPATGWLLLVSAANNLAETVGTLLLLGVDVLARDALGRTPLNIATQQGHAAVMMEILRYMTGSGASDEKPGHPYMSDIWRARLVVGSREIFNIFEEFNFRAVYSRLPVMSDWFSNVFSKWQTGNVRATGMFGALLPASLSEVIERVKAWLQSTVSEKNKNSAIDVNAVIVGNSGSGSGSGNEGYPIGSGVLKVNRSRNLTLIHIAISNSNNTVLSLQALLQMPNIEVDARDAAGKTPLLSLAANNIARWDRMASILLEAGANVNASGANGLSPLWWIVYQGRSDYVKLLLEYGADRDGWMKRDSEGRSALFGAAKTDAFAVMDELFPGHDWGAAINYRNAAGDTLLREMIIESGFEGDTKDWLSANGFEFNAVNWANRGTGLHLIARNREGEVEWFLEAAEAMFRKALTTSNAAEIIAAEVLTRDGPNPEKLPKVLTGVSYHPEVIEVLLRLAGIKSKQVEKEVPVEVTVDGDEEDKPFVVRTQDDVEIQPRNFRRDLSDGACFATRDVLRTTGESANMYRAEVQQCLEGLLGNAVERERAVRAVMASFVNARRGSDGRTAFHLAINKAGRDVDFNEVAEVARILLQNGARMDLLDQRGKSVFHVAASLQDTQIMQVLLEAYVKNFKQEKGWPEEGPLALDQAVEVATAVVAEMNRTDVMEGDDPVYSGTKEGIEVSEGFRRERNGQTPLHVAVLSSKPEMVRYVLNAPETAFRMAVGLSADGVLSQEQAEVLRQVPKVDVTKKDLRGRTPLLFAELYSGPEVGAGDDWEAVVNELRALAGDAESRRAVLDNLEHAIMNRDEDGVSRILAANPGLDSFADDVKRRRAIRDDLVDAIICGDSGEVSRILVTNPDLKDFANDTKGRYTNILDILCSAIMSEKQDTVSRILAVNPDIDMVGVGPNGLTPLGLAVRCGNAETVEKLLNYMITQERAGQYNATIMEMMDPAKEPNRGDYHSDGEFQQFHEKYEKILQLLYVGFLHLAVLNGNVSDVRQALAYMVAPERIIKYAREVRMAKMLVDRLPKSPKNRNAIQGFWADAENRVNEALKRKLLEITAIPNGDVTIVKQILAAGVDVESSKQALRNAVHSGTADVARVLLDYMTTPERIDTCSGLIIEIKQKVDAWTEDTESRDEIQNYQALAEAKITEAREGEQVLTVTPELLPSVPNFDATVALFREIISENVEGVRDALGNGAFADTKNVEGDTALSVAIGKRNLGIIKMLLDHMTTPWHISASATAIKKECDWEETYSKLRQNHTEILQYLREAMAKVNAPQAVARTKPENYPTLDDREPTTLEEIVLKVGIFYSEASNEVKNYKGLPQIIRDYLQRLGVVVPEGDTIHPTRELHLVVVSHQPITESTAIWRWKGDLQGLCAVRIFSTKGQVQFVEPFDVPVAGGLRVASLPNRFLKKSFPCTAENDSQFRLRFPQQSPGSPPPRFFILVMTPNQVYVTVEEFMQ